MSSQRIPRRAIFADSGTGWKKRSGVPCMTWCRGMKESCKGLASVGPSRLPVWGPRYGATQNGNGNGNGNHNHNNQCKCLLMIMMI
ncbi:unnamed protein product [Schistosoma mattheei]|uniref:Uncharacterized protein n=1 Tax=Schistosoma mattheei TaxID=31246 RepID=A0A183NNW4_9TREM|nr:unnamed protein product [Schistosoma mattheei]